MLLPQNRMRIVYSYAVLWGDSRKRLRTFRSRLCLLMMFSLGTVFAVSADYVPRFESKSLNGEEVRLPNDIKGFNAGFNALLIVGFSRKSWEQTKQWSLKVSKMSSCDGQHPVQWYQLAVLSDVPRLIRPVVLRAIRSGLSPEVRSHFVPVYSSSEGWKESVRFSAQDDAYIALISKTGHVEHVWQGVYDEAKRSEVEHSLCSAAK
jgi:hypothetical protein